MCVMFNNIFIILGICLNEKHWHWIVSRAKFFSSDSPISLFGFLSLHTAQHPSDHYWQSCWPGWGLSLPVFLDCFIHIWPCKCHSIGYGNVLCFLSQYPCQSPSSNYSGCMTLMPRMFMNTFIILKICMHEKYQHWKLHFTFLSLCFVPPCFCTFLFFSVSLLLSSLFLHHLPFCSVGLLDWVYWIDYWVWGYLLSHVNVRVTEMRGEWGCTWV